MPYDEKLANRVRDFLLARGGNVTEMRMFGGITFLVDDHMGCGVVGDDLMVRVGPASYEELLEEPHARPMDFTGKPMRGFLYVGPAGFKTRAALAAWIERALSFTSSLPAKTAAAKLETRSKTTRTKGKAGKSPRKASSRE